MKKILFIILSLFALSAQAQSGKIIGGTPPRFISRPAVKPDITLYASNTSEADLTALADSLGGRNMVTLVITKGAGAANPSFPAIVDTLLGTKFKVKVYATASAVGIFQADDGFTSQWDGTNFVPNGSPIIQIADSEEYTFWPIKDGSLKYWAYTKTSSTADGNGIISALPLDTVTINNANPLRIVNGTNSYNFDGYSTMWTNSAGGKYFGLQGNNASGWNAGFGVRAAGNYSLEREAHAASSGYNARIFDITYLPWNGYAVPHDAMNITTEGEVVHAYGDPFGVWGQRTEFYAATSFASSKRSFLFKNVTSYHANKKLVDFQNASGTIAALKQDGKFYVGADSSFVHDPTVDSTLFKGSVRQTGNIYKMSGSNAGRNFSNILLFKSDAAYNVAGTSFNTPGVGQFNWYIGNDQRGYGEDGFGIKNENLHSPGIGPNSYYTLFTIRNNGNIELGYPYLTRLVRATGDTFAVQSTYNPLPSSAVSSPFLVVAKNTPTWKIRLFNAYEMPTQTPIATNGVKSIQVWTGNGSATTSAFERLRKDTTVYIDNADLNWTSGITTEMIGRLYHTVTFWMTTTAAAGSNSDLTLPVPDANLMQTRFEVHSVDEAGGFDNVIQFGANNAVDSTNGLVGSYFPAAGQLVVIKAGLRSGVYKYRYSNNL